MNRLVRVAGLALALVLLVAGAGAQQVVGGIYGKVLGFDGKPLAGGKVVFHSLEFTNRNYPVKINKKGSYGHFGLPFGSYEMEIFTPDGKMVYKQKVQSKIDRTHLNINLKEQAAEAQARQGAQGGQQGAAPQAGAGQQGNKVAAQKGLQQKLLNQLNGMLKQASTQGQAGNWQGAVQTLQQAQTLAPTVSVIKGNLAFAYLNAKQYPQAIASAQQAIQLDPTNGGFHDTLAEAMIENGQGKAALPELDKAATLDPADAGRFYYNSAVRLSQKNDNADEVAVLNKAIQADPKNANNYYLKGMALLAQSSYDSKTSQPIIPAGTRAAFKQYLTLQPTGQIAATVKQTLAQLNNAETVKAH